MRPYTHICTYIHTMNTDPTYIRSVVRSPACIHAYVYIHTYTQAMNQGPTSLPIHKYDLNATIRFSTLQFPHMES
jgi:hypothetical protein